MPDKQDPMWPSADADSASGTPDEQGRDGAKTAFLPVPNPSSQPPGAGRSDELVVPKITPGRQADQRRAEHQQAEPRAAEQRQAEQGQTERRAAEQRQAEQRAAEQRQAEQRAADQRQAERRAAEQRAADQWQAEQRRAEQRQAEQRTSWFNPVSPVFPPLDSPTSAFRPVAPAPRQPSASPEPRQSGPRRPESFSPLPPIPAAPHAIPMRIEPTGESYPAEATTGADRDVETHQQGRELSKAGEAAEPAGPRKPPQDAPKVKRPGRGLLIGGLALLLVVAAGVTAALPQVSNRLELPWAPNKPRGAAPQPVAVSLALHGPEATAASPTPAGVTRVLDSAARNPAFSKLTGSVLDAETGSVLWDRNSGQPLTPASTTKLLTVAAALLSVDHGLQLSTKVVQGAQPGTVILVGGGDPTLSSLPIGKDSTLYPGSAHLDDLVAQVKKATGGDVKKVQLDVSAYAGPVTAPGWDPSDTPSTYAASMVPVMLDGGRSDPGSDHSMRVANPATMAAQQLAQRLGAQAQPGVVTAANNARVLGEVKSAPLTELVDTLLLNSDDTLADAVARQTAIATGAEPSFAGAATATLNVLSRNGFDLTGVQLNDGSGLSQLNKIPAKVLSQVLAVAAGPDGKDPRTAKLRPLLGGLPVAGGSGTLATRYVDASSSSGKGWLRAKTGTLSGVNTLAGLVLDTDGRVLVFALMSSGPDQNTSRAGLDALAANLRGCGCR